MLSIIGLGLNDEKDINVKGLEIVRKADLIYLESYTSSLNVSKERLELYYGKKVIEANRELVENSSEIIDSAKSKNIVFLVPGDPFIATTHIDLILQAHKRGIEYEIINNASILNAIGKIGLQIYKFGKIASIPLNNEDIETPYDVLKDNLSINAHTLFLLDLDPKNSKYLSIKDAVHYLLKVEIKRHGKIFNENTLCIGCRKLGSKEEIIKVGKAKDLAKIDFKEGVKCLIVPAKLHFVEEEALEMWKL